MPVMLQKIRISCQKKVLGYGLCLAFLLSTPLSYANGKEKLFYHYVNERGEPFIGTTMQPEYIQYGYTIKDIHGTVIKKVTAQKTMTQDEKKTQKMLIDRKRRENHLARLYGSAAAAERTLKSNVTTAEIKIGIIESNLMLQKQKLETTENAISEFQQQGQSPPPELIEKQKQEAERFLSLENAKKNAEKDKQKMIEKFEKDIKSLQEMEYRQDAELRSKKHTPIIEPLKKEEPSE